MKTYFAYLSHSTMPKNRLQKAVWEMLENESNRLTVNVEMSIARIRKHINQLNDANPKCQPLLVNDRNYDDDKAITLYIRLENDQGPGVNFTFHPLKK